MTVNADQWALEEYALEFPITIVTVIRSDATRVDVIDDLLGRGVQLPEGMVILDWYRDAYPPHQRLDEPHQSIYYKLSDLETGSGGEVIVERQV